MSWLVSLPVQVPLLIAAVVLLFRGSQALQKGLAVFGLTATLIASLALGKAVGGDGLLVSQAGSWPAPFGISFVADRLSALMTIVAAILVLLCAIFSQPEDQSRNPWTYPFFLILLAGANGAFLTGDLFNLYVWFEVLLVNSFTLLILGGGRAQLKGAVPYVTMSLVASAILLSAIGAIYGITGTLNMAELCRRLAASPARPLFLPAAALFLVALGIKAAAFPLFFWLPKAYPTAPVAVTAAFSGLLTKVAVYVLIRFVTLFLAPDMAALRQPLMMIAGLTMLTGVLGAASQDEVRRILSFHIVSQIGYMIMGLAFFTPLGVAGAIYFMIHNIFAKSNLFLIGGVAERSCGSFELKKLGGLYRSSPWLSFLFVISAFSLAGLPPLSGFWGKFALARAGFDSGNVFIVGVSLFVGLMTLYSMTKIWTQAFWKPGKSGGGRRSGPVSFAPIVSLSALTIALGVGIEPVFKYLLSASSELLNPTAYVAAVLDRRGVGK